MDELETIMQAVSGDDAAQRRLYRAHHAAAFRLAYLLLQNTCDAEEVVQDSFVYVFRNLKRYQPERGTLWSWLRVVLVSRCRNKRRRKQLPSVSIDVLVGTDRVPPDERVDNDPEGALELRGLQRTVWEALQQVSPAARDALILRFYEELPYGAIADILGCSADAARARVAHGKMQLRRLLSPSEGEKAGRRSSLRTAEARLA
jgi:RNA polymerase sigma-70 factor (ECF subfamily)